MMTRQNRAGRLVAGLFFSTVSLTAAAAPPPSVEITMQFTPRQRDVDYEIPTPAEYPKCKVDAERNGKSFTWVVFGPEGQVLRRFVDSDGDNKFDQWRYYRHGIEVYRDMDTNANGKPDQARWLNLGGSRWGIDANEDGRLEQWRVLSAAEASRVAIQAMTTGDTSLMQTLMVTPADLQSLGVNSQLAAKILETAASAPSDMQAVMAKSKVMSPQSRWIRFDAQMPGVIPVDEGKSRSDLYVYENAMVVIETGAPGSQPALVQIGEMIRVGEVWKLTKVPTPIESNSTSITAGGVLMQPLLGDPATDLIAAPSPETQKLIEALQKLDQSQPQLGVAKPAELSAYNAQRADLLLRLMAMANSEEEKAQFLRQCVDGLAAAIQTDAYPEGLERLRTMEAEQRRNPRSTVLPYITYRRIMSEYSISMKSAEGEKQQQVQEDWLKSLANFIEVYPEADDAGDAMLQLAVAQEFGGKLKDATEWYARLAKDKSGSTAASKAEGAIRRLEMKGKPFALTGQGLTGGPINTASYRGKTLLVFYWATWCQPCQADLPALRALYQQYQSRGFEIVGVCLDIPAGTRPQQVAQLQQYLQSNRVTWPQIYEEGGLDSPPATHFGIISLPTMFLVDSKGVVVSRSSSVDELKTVLPQILTGQANSSP